MLRAELDQPIGLVKASKQLGVDLFDYAGLLATEGRQLDGGRIPASELEALRTKHQIEWWWVDSKIDAWEDAESCVRAVLGAMLQRGCVEPLSTRRDNLWRGLSRDLRDTLEETVEVLLDEGVLSARGRRDISIASTGVGVVHMIAAGTTSPPSLVEIWGEQTNG